jgi:hypothetical protein
MPAKVSRNAAIIRAAKRGATNCDLAEQYGISSQRVGQILIRAGLNAKPGRKPLPLNGDDRKTYLKLRAHLGADAARQEMGIAEYDV